MTVYLLNNDSLFVASIKNNVQNVTSKKASTINSLFKIESGQFWICGLIANTSTFMETKN